jgi:membrane protease YdiL (CAAX protease family)
LRQHEVNWKDAFGWQNCEPATAAAYGVLAAMLFLPAAWGLQVISSHLMDFANLNPQEQEAVQELQDPSLNVAEKVVMGVITIVLAPVVEEALFRGILYPAIKRLGQPRVALWVSSILFGLVHHNMVTFLPLMVFALVLVHLYETFQNLLAPIVAHSLFNATNFLILIFQDQIVRFLHAT